MTIKPTNNEMIKDAIRLILKTSNKNWKDIIGTVSVEDLLRINSNIVITEKKLVDYIKKTKQELRAIEKYTVVEYNFDK